MSALPPILHPTARTVLEASRKVGTGRAAIAAHTGLDPQTVYVHSRKLRDAGLMGPPAPPPDPPLSPAAVRYLREFDQYLHTGFGRGPRARMRVLAEDMRGEAA